MNGKDDDKPSLLQTLRRGLGEIKVNTTSIICQEYATEMILGEEGLEVGRVISLRTPSGAKVGLNTIPELAREKL